ncbi:FMN-binding negative transcriptional regulator [Imtechella halotolerans]|uniref:FMN-binding negative transcriptional regulator n=1 Tax=Imtechella halotolerans K1 TaxID=946077 RepID=I0WDZ2_9FLAO|nr:FMN-binding negative transcriptional regulator [Imtechella halotolerans]EID74608.1 FMN-binding negative transcriptional regulator [Imtechella halotolerans K1]WMQ62456.1 FMN-binding negative transcriptional regulator [Imtechella halotolerans]
MNYPPKHHQEQNFENIVSLIKEYPLATMLSVKDNDVLATHVPLIYEKTENYGKLIGHLDKFNPQLETIQNGTQVTIIFHGPDTYISPSVYSTPQLPTWNYLKAHLKGKVNLYTDKEKIKRNLISMTEFMEDPSPNYILAPDNPRMLAYLDYIVGFEITITNWEGKYKFSQDKLSKDQELAKLELINKNQHRINDFIEHIFSNHQQA